MTWDDEIPTHLLDDDEAPYIVERLGEAERDDNEPDLDVAKVRLLLGQARLAHRRCVSDWRRRRDPAHKAPRSDGPYKAWENTKAGNPGRFRDGSNIPKSPLVAIYFICNEWWRRETGTAFHCDFDAWDFADEFEGDERLAYLNAAARFFFLVAQAVNEVDYTVKRCILVHNLYYRKLNTDIR